MAKRDREDSSAPGEEEPGFDRRLARLEELVRELEDGGLELEQGIERYREGVALLKGCREQLEGYRRQVEELSREAAGALERYENDPDLAAGGGAGRGSGPR